ncbi:hypothetical protein H9I32_03810 [Bacillus sp. Xin]|uniref:hypothetical protein n=1 Tax=unclassified Bacillus (in: firmicutes) TaxID=185979 RepID=UPI0015717CB2|nr:MULTISPECIES: hypothetical protein [unclassified Bacillus (in: firmicutes)]MBC6971584.1 hypothetical protein [Bacillus sp. Xin]NSW38314.1 hypothetical protein [Bacillus sp. Xin1]
MEINCYTDTVDPDRQIIQFTSETLKNNVPESAYLGEELGTCMAIIRKGMDGSYTSAVVALGHNNP